MNVPSDIFLSLKQLSSITKKHHHTKHKPRRESVVVIASHTPPRASHQNHHPKRLWGFTTCRANLPKDGLPFDPWYPNPCGRES